MFVQFQLAMSKMWVCMNLYNCNKYNLVIGKENIEITKTYIK
jgi:hypothetical protein